MPRVRGRVAAHHRHKKILKVTKGQRATRHSLYRRAHEAMLKSLSYSFAHRRKRKGDFRKLWITRINAAAKKEGLSYSKFINGLKKANVNIDRKMLSEMAVSDPHTFAELVKLSKQHS